MQILRYSESPFATLSVFDNMDYLESDRLLSMVKIILL